MTQQFEAMKANAKLLEAMSRQMTVADKQNMIHSPSKQSPGRKSSRRDTRDTIRKYMNQGVIPEHSVLTSTFKSKLPECSQDDELSQ